MLPMVIQWSYLIIMYPQDDLQLVGADHVPRCRAVIDQRFPDFHAINLLASGRMVFAIDQGGEEILQGPCLFWTLPQHRYRYRPAEDHWRHWWVACTGRRAQRLFDQGLQVLAPQGWIDLGRSDPARSHFQTCVRAVHTQDPRLAGHAVVALDALYLLVQDQVLGTPSPHLDVIDRCARQLRDHPQPDYDFAHLAAQAGCSYSHFRRQFRARYGCGLHAYLLDARMRAAARELLQSEDSVQVIAERFGYGDPSRFNKLFRQRIGIAPGRYRAGVPFNGAGSRRWSKAR